MLVPKSRSAWIAVPVVATVLVAGAAGAVIATSSGPSDDSAFVVDHFLTPAVPSGGSFSQSVKQLWFGENVTGFTKVDGAGWLSVDGSGHVTGTAPATAPSDLATITVRGTDGEAKNDITLMVPVLDVGEAPTVEVASWNLADAGAGASYSAEQKQLHAIIANDIQVLGLQETGGRAAAELAHDLGWYSYQSSGDLGIVSAYPISDVTEPTATTPAAGVTLDVRGRHLRVWTAHLDESGYGPDRACGGSTTPAQLVNAEKASTRYAQASAIAQKIASDVAGAVPVVLLGDLASPAGTDWTTVTKAAHCNVGAVSWPVPELFTGSGGAGLIDSYRQAFPDPAANPGTTLSPLAPAAAMTSRDRVDYVAYAGPLQVAGAESLFTGWTDADGQTRTSWPSDHAAAVTLFRFTNSAAPGTPGVSPLVVTAERDVLRPSKPTITGPARVGRKLKAHHGKWSPRPTYRYQWYVGGKAIKHAIRATYRPTAGQRGKRVTVKVTGSAPGHRSVTVKSRATAKVT